DLVSATASTHQCGSRSSILAGPSTPGSCPPIFVARRVSILALGLLWACTADPREAVEAGVGGDRSGCGEPGSNSHLVSEHSCACDAGYDWCSEALDDFDCCPIEAGEGDTGDTAEGPELSCD